MVLEEIDYKNVFRYFEEISNIPRGSKNNKGISDFLVQFAKEHQLKCVQDSAYNVIIIKEASEGYESCPALILQGHMDMVCEKEAGVEHDFTQEGLKLKIKDDYIFAEGTTLGGDDGIALAYAMAFLTDEELVHPRLEVIITTDEEIGMDGAMSLDTSDLQGKYMINLDSDEEGVFLTGCAGGLTGSIKLPLKYETVEEKLIKISISNLLGGHSGADINKNRTNATILLGRLLLDLKKQQYHIIQLQGGQKDNVITREAYAELSVQEEQVYTIINEIKFLTEKYKAELRSSEPNLTIQIEQGDTKQYQVLDQHSADHMVFLLVNVPNGVQVMSSNLENMVESSLNPGIFQMEKDMAYLSFSVRSSLSSYKEFLSSKLRMLAEHLGGMYEVKGEYPAWEYKKDSRLRNLMCAVYEKEYGKEPKIEAIHAGLECGIISNKIKEIDIVSMGPDIFDIHTPQERLSISSAKRVYDYLVKTMEEYCKTMN